MKKKAIVKSLEVAKTALKKYSPQILTGIGIAGNPERTSHVGPADSSMAGATIP